MMLLLIYHIGAGSPTLLQTSYTFLQINGYVKASMYKSVRFMSSVNFFETSPGL